MYFLKQNPIGRLFLRSPPPPPVSACVSLLVHSYYASLEERLHLGVGDLVLLTLKLAFRASVGSCPCV
jgi:hypothetical protein